MRTERMNHRFGERDAIGEVLTPVDRDRGDPGGPGALKRTAIRPITDDDLHRNATVEDRLENGASAGGKHADLHVKRR